VGTITWNHHIIEPHIPIIYLPTHTRATYSTSYIASRLTRRPTPSISLHPVAPSSWPSPSPTPTKWFEPESRTLLLRQPLYLGSQYPLSFDLYGATRASWAFIKDWELMRCEYCQERVPLSSCTRIWCGHSGIWQPRTRRALQHNQLYIIISLHVS